MGRFNQSKQKSIPAVNTSALPDIIFMLLFFFMVATTMKEVNLQVDIEKPTADQAVALEDKDNIDFLYIGFPTNAEHGTEPRIQLDDMLINDYHAIQEWKRSSIPQGRSILEVPTSFKVHKDVGMRTVSLAKEELREIDALKIIYSADKTE
ncbi:MAG: biopolymer transporter ExbD [Flavobacteriales bacterium]|nr:biopolymer transporter ExbD [Flavobacteriales bacterium]